MIDESAEVEQYKQWLAAADDNWQTIRTERDKLREERDEARREMCEEIRWIDDQGNVLGGSKEYAAHRGWDCFKEETQ